MTVDWGVLQPRPFSLPLFTNVGVGAFCEVRAWPRSMPPWRSSWCYSGNDHEHKEVTRGGLLLHATHPTWQAGGSQGHLRRGRQAPSGRVRSVSPPSRHTQGEGVVPE